MLCENCKENVSTSIFLSPITNKYCYLCGKCYEKLNHDVELQNLAKTEIDNTWLKVKCPICGTTGEEYLNSQFFGCENCYSVFESLFKANFFKNFQQNKYTGKCPNAFFINKQIKQLEQMVEICLKNGNLQKATKYGLEIKKLKESLDGRM